MGGAIAGSNIMKQLAAQLNHLRRAQNEKNSNAARQVSRSQATPAAQFQLTTDNRIMGSPGSPDAKKFCAEHDGYQ